MEFGQTLKSMINVFIRTREEHRDPDTGKKALWNKDWSDDAFTSQEYQQLLGYTETTNSQGRVHS